LLPADTTVTAAIAAMKQAARAAVCVHDRRKLWIVKAADLMLAKRAGGDTLSDVKRRHSVLEMTAPVASSRGLDLIRPQDTWSDYEQVLDQENARYMALLLAPFSRLGARATGPAAGGAVIVTRHEDWADELSTPGDYYCTGPRQHAFPPPTVRAGQDCPRGDNAKVVRG
jgi:hypothetical protein